MPLVFGTPAFLFYRKRPTDSIRVNHIFTNSPCLDFVLVGDIKAGGVGLLIQESAIDACAFLDENVFYDVPIVTVNDAFVFIGYYTGVIPYGYKKNSVFDFTVTFRGITVDEKATNEWILEGVPGPKRATILRKIR